LKRIVSRSRVLFTRITLKRPPVCRTYAANIADAASIGRRGQDLKIGSGLLDRGCRARSARVRGGSARSSAILFSNHRPSASSAAIGEAQPRQWGARGWRRAPAAPLLPAGLLTAARVESPHPLRELVDQTDPVMHVCRRAPRCTAFTAAATSRPGRQREPRTGHLGVALIPRGRPPQPLHVPEPRGARREPARGSSHKLVLSRVIVSSLPPIGIL
jgi:hypothetical protein